jgi:hypothetical protein
MTGACVLLKCRTPRARLVCGEIYTPMILRTQNSVAARNRQSALPLPTMVPRRALDFRRRDFRGIRGESCRTADPDPIRGVTAYVDR